VYKVTIATQGGARKRALDNFAASEAHLTSSSTDRIQTPVPYMGGATLRKRLTSDEGT